MKALQISKRLARHRVVLVLQGPASDVHNAVLGIAIFRFEGEGGIVRVHGCLIVSQMISDMAEAPV